MKPDTHLLNTESKLSPEVQPFVPNHLKDQKPPGAAVTLDGRLRGRRQHFQRSGWTGALSRDGEPQGDGRSLSPQFPTQKSLTKDSQSGQANRRGSSHSQWAKKAPQSKPSTLDGVLSKQPGQPSRPSSELISHETRRLANMKEGSLQKAGHIKIQQRDADAFEVKLSDFPELGLPAINGSNVTFPSGPQSPGKSTLLEKGESAGPPQTPKSQGAQLKSTQGSTLEPMVSSPTSPTASWAAVACQPPRRAVLRAAGPVPQPTSASKAQQREAKNEQRPEPTSRKKQNKKKKKSKPVDECGEAEVLVVEQEPPKFEDEEEFPNLTHTLIGCTKGQSPAPSFLSQNPSRMHVEGGPAQENRDTTLHADGTPLQDDRGRSRVSVVKPPLPAQPTTESKKGQKVEKLSSKKSKVPVQLDLGNMLAVLEQKQISQKSKQESKPIILSVGGGPPVAQKDAAQKKNPRQPEKMAHNPLDSTCPLVKKGKQREVPKAKKPTPLKRIILKEREERKQRRLLEEWGFGSPGFDVETSENVELEALQLELDEPDPTGEDDPGEHVPTDVEGPAESEPEQADCRKQLSQDTAQHPKIHSRKFRDYCNQMLSKDVDESVTSLLKELVRFQDRLYQKDPMKARMKRRLVMGLREVLKHLKLRKVKCVVISPNCERIQSKGGLDETLHTIIDTCREQSVPFVFALSRKALGRCVNKAVPVSLVGIFNYDGAQDLYHKMIELSSEARKAYEVMIANLEKTSLEPQEVSSGQQDADTIADQSDSEEPAYIKIWKRMLEMECDHKFFNFEEQLSTGTMHSEPRAPCEDEGS